MMSNSITVTESMKKRALVSLGDRSRLYSVIKRAARGETITFSVIGGSITHGCHASSRRNSYAELAALWWKEKFPGTVVNYINAGIGATDSYIGVHRADNDLLCHRPDVVIAEFSVNDTDEKINALSYRALIEKILLSGPDTAVILLFTLDRNGYNLQHIHSAAGAEYNLPMISYADAVFPEIQAGRIRWEDISPDDIHPSDEGHRIIAELINDYMEGVFSEAFDADCAVTVPVCTESVYRNASLIDSRDDLYCERDGFECFSESHQFPHGWTSENGGIIKFRVTARNIGIMYYRTAGSRSGVYDVYVDGVYMCSLDGDFPGGWGDYTDYREVYTSESASEHEILLKTSENTVYKAFSVNGICVS